MTPDDTQTAIQALLATWRGQPMSDHERKAWERALRAVTLDEFQDALDLARDQGGSLLMRNPGYRPNVGEFVGLVRMARRKALVTAEAEHWPEKDPALARREVARIKAALAMKGAVA